MKKLIALATAAAFLLVSCSRAVVVPLDPEPRIEAKQAYRVTTTSGEQFNTRDLIVHPDSVMFTSDRPYAFARSDVKSIERIEVDETRTTIAIIVVVAVLVGGIYAFLAAVGLPATD